MKVKLILVGAMIAASLSLFGCSQSPGQEFMQDATVERTCDMFQEEPHYSGDVVLGVDGTLTVILCSNQTTGFKWSESPEISDSTILQQEDYEWVRPEGDVAGAAGKEIFTFKTLKEGVSNIYFEYSQPWEGGEKGAWTFELEVHARELPAS